MVPIRLPRLPRRLQRVVPGSLLTASLALLLGCSLRTSALEAMGPPAPRIPVVPPLDRPGPLIPGAAPTLQSPQATGFVRTSYQAPMPVDSQSPPKVLPLPEAHGEEGFPIPGSLPPVPANPSSGPSGVVVPPGGSPSAPSGVVVPPDGPPPGSGWVPGPSTVPAQPDGTVLLPTPAPSHNEVVVNLPTVLRLADQQNPRILLAREQVNEAVQACCVANSLCRPMCCRDDDFKPIQAEAKVWQRRAALAKVRYEVLSDAGTTYINWLAARRTEVILVDLEARLRQVLQRAETLAKEQRGAQVLVYGIRSALDGQEQLRLTERQQADAAAIKLVALLDLPNACLVPGDADLLAFDLVDTSQPCEALLTQALSNGPGIRELEQLAAVVRGGIAKAGILQTFANMGCKAACCRLRMLQSKEAQVALNLEETRCEIARGTLQERDAILIGRERMQQGQAHIANASETFRLSDARLRDHRPEETSNVYPQMLQSIRALEAAYLGTVAAITSYDQAEVRLYLLLGNVPGAEVVTCGTMPQP